MPGHDRSHHPPHSGPGQPPAKTGPLLGLPARDLGHPPGVPNRTTIQAFMAHAEALGAVGVSFWSWQGANDGSFAAIRDAPEFIMPVRAAVLAPGQLRCYQVLMTSLG